MDRKYYFLKTLIKSYYDFQLMRIRFSNRLEIKKNGEAMNKDENRNYETIVERDEENRVILQSLYENCLEQESFLEKRIKKIVHKMPMWECFFKEVKGCGEMMAGVLLTEVDINIATTVSKLWAFSGLAPGKDRKKKGEKCPFNQFLRSKLCGVLGSGFLKCNSPYREYYDNMKHRLESENWGTESKNPTDKKRPKAGHQHKAANRYMVKMFLRDLYVAWRTLEGLPIRKPYDEEYLGREHSS
jgi:hypothetical protein